MSKLMKLLFLGIVFSMIFTSSSYAAENGTNITVTKIKEFSEKGLRQEMWVWASLEEELDAAHSGGVPVVPPLDAEYAIDLAVKNINSYVSLINNAKNLEEAKKLANSFLEIGGTNKNVARYLIKLLDIRESFMKANGIL